MKKLCFLLIPLYLLAISCTKESYEPIEIKEVKEIVEDVECQGADLISDQSLLK